MNGFYFEKSHLGLDEVSSILVFIAEILLLQLGMQPKTNFNILLKKNYINQMVVFIKGRYIIIKLWCLLNWSVLSLSDGSRSEPEFKYNVSETWPGFPCRVYSFSLFLFPCYSIFFCKSESYLSFYHHYLHIHIHQTIESLSYLSFTLLLLTHLGVLVFFQLWSIFRFR